MSPPSHHPCLSAMLHCDACGCPCALRPHARVPLSHSIHLYLHFQLLCFFLFKLLETRTEVSPKNFHVNSSDRGSTIGSSVSEETSKSQTHAMTTRTGLRAVVGCGRVPHDHSKDSRDSVTMALRLRTPKKPSDFPIVARSLSRTDESASSTAPIHILRHNLDDGEALM